MKRKKPCFLFIIICLVSGVYILWNILRGFLQESVQKARFDISLLQEELVYVLKYEPHTQNDSLHHFGYDAIKSRNITPNRNIPDTRPPSCHTHTPDVTAELPSPSIVITVHEVDKSVLFRNIASILSRSSPVVIHEIIVVADGSSENGDFFTKHSGIKVIRSKQAQGRGVSRTLGAAVATGDVLVFVDGLTEVNVNWLSPLLQRLIESPKSLVVPVLDIIDHMTFEYVPFSRLVRGGFDWGLQYHWEDVPVRYQEMSNPLSAVRSPVVSGSVLAVRRDYFNWLGKYDNDTGARDTEDMEFSLRTWLCGGQVEIIPCSKVGIIHVKGRERGLSPMSVHSYIRSARRLAEIWLDDYKRFFYAVRPSARMQPIANISSQRRRKEKLRCRNFKWFLTFIYPQLQPLVSDEVAYGHIQQGSNCLDLDPGQLPLVAKLRSCEENKDSQEWSWKKKGVIVSRGMCLTSDLINMQGFVVVQFCKNMETQMWYRHGEKIVHQDTNLCLDGHQGNTGLVITDCIKDRKSQAWIISTEKQVNKADIYTDDNDDHFDVHDDSQL